MMDIIYEIPSDKRIKEVILTDECIKDKYRKPVYVYKTEEDGKIS